MHSSMTLDEFLEILDSLDCEYEVYENEEENFRWIDCDLFGAEFIVFPIGPGPFFEVFSLEAIRPAEFDPETMCTAFNKMQDFAKAIPFDLNDTGEHNEGDLDESRENSPHMVLSLTGRRTKSRSRNTPMKSMVGVEGLEPPTLSL